MPGEITLHSSCVSQVTCVSNEFIDKYMPSSSGEFVKTYLYLLRCVSQSTCSFSIHNAADALNHTEGDIRRALEYWEDKGLIRMEYDSAGAVVGICVLSRPDNQADSFKGSVQPSVARHESPVYDTSEYDAPAFSDSEYDACDFSASEYDESSFNDADFEELFRVAEQFKGKPLSSKEMEIIMSWRCVLGFSVDLIEYLIEMSMNNNHPSFYYMNAIALKWKADGITTEDQARNSGSIHSRTYYAVVKAFGIKQRNLNRREQEYLDKWTGIYNFSDELIVEACERALANTGKVSFSYAEKILKDWHSQNFNTLSDVASHDAKRKKAASASPKPVSKTTSFSDFTQRSATSTDLTELERKLLQ